MLPGWFTGPVCPSGWLLGLWKVAAGRWRHPPATGIDYDDNTDVDSDLDGTGASPSCMLPSMSAIAMAIDITAATMNDRRGWWRGS